MTIAARLERDGTASLKVDDQPAATADFFGPFLDTPADGLSVGFDEGKPVGDYPAKFAFEGEINTVDVEILRAEPG